MKNSISIIIPCYNVESYIVKCLDSLIKQLNDFTYEIILVNDCSKDNTEDIINQYIKEHPSSNISYFSNDNNICIIQYFIKTIENNVSESRHIVACMQPVICL